MKNYIPYGEPTISFKEINAVVKVIKSKWIGSGPVTQRFEKKFKVGRLEFPLYKYRMYSQNRTKNSQIVKRYDKLLNFNEK